MGIFRLPMEALLDLPEINLYNIDECIGDDETGPGLKKTQNFLAMYSLIASKVNCPRCNTPMAHTKDKSRTDRCYWRCNECRRHGASGNRKLSIRHGTFFEEARIGLGRILKLAAMWATHPEETFENVAKACSVSKGTVIDYYNQFSDICRAWFERVATNTQLGGPETIVELEESKFFRAKYNRERELDNECDWVYMMMEQGSDRMGYFTAPKRDAATLLALIRQRIEPGTSIVYDGWQTYGGISKLQQQYDNIDVDHNTHFVDPTDLQMDAIESTWAELRRTLKRQYGTSKLILSSYMYQYMFLRYHGNEKILNHLLYEIGLLFPV